MIYSNITTESQYQGLQLLNQQNYSTPGYFTEILDAISARINHMVMTNSKVLMTRVDVKFPQEIQATPDNLAFQDFIETYTRQLKNQAKLKDCFKRKYFYPQYLWSREVNLSHNHHYHLMLLINANAIQHFRGIQQMTAYWAKSLKKFHYYPGDAQGCIYYCKNGLGETITIDRNNPASIAVAFQLGSYLAKVSTKDQKLNNINSWSCSRINH